MAASAAYAQQPIVITRYVEVDPEAEARYMRERMIVSQQESIAKHEKDIAKIKAKAERRKQWHDKDFSLNIGRNSPSAADVAEENEARRQGIAPGELTNGDKNMIAFYEGLIAMDEEAIAAIKESARE